jgi:putative membrane protein
VTSSATLADWQRLSAWSVLHNIASALRHLVNNFFALIPLAYGITRLPGELIIGLVLFAIVAAIVLWAVLHYRTFAYSLRDDSVLVRQGIVFKKQLDLAFVRIQNVTFEYPFYLRPMGLVTIKIDSAGSSGDEVYLAALEADEAEAIRKEILERKAHLARDDVADDAPSSDLLEAGDLLIDRQLPDLILHGLTNNRAWIILGGVGAVIGQGGDQIPVFVMSLGIDPEEFFSQSVGMMLLLFASALVLSVLIVAGLSVLGSIFSYYNFHLYGTNDAFSVHRGLLTKHEIHMRKSRVQTILFREDWLDRVLGRLNLVFEQLSHKQAGMMDEKVLVPTITRQQANELAWEVVPIPNPVDLDFACSHIRYFAKLAIVWTTLYVVVAAGFGLGLEWKLAALPLPLWATHMVLMYLTWLRKGIAVDGEMIIGRGGIIGIDYVVMQAYKLQGVSFTQSPFMRRRGLATLKLRVASRSIRMPFIDVTVARQIMDFGLLEVEAPGSHGDHRSWM